MKKKENATLIFGILFMLYAAMMLWLLFDRPSDGGGLSYWSQVKLNLNLIPLRTVALYIRTLMNTGNAYLLRHAIINLAGNVIMFVPLGALLPAIWPTLRKFWKCWLCSAGCIAVIEILQLFTLLGSCDIDDLILNLVGVSIGFGCYILLRPKN